MDFNNDGMLDIVIGDRDGFLYFFKRTGPGIHDLTGAKIRDSGGIIDTGYNSAPAVVDWNNDGLLDMVVGDGYYGGTHKTRIYLNSGTTRAHRFTNWNYLQNAGTDMRVRSCMPAVYDLNGDGKKDFLAGMESGNIYYFENKGTDARPVFNGYIKIKANGVDIKVRRAARLHITDWNNDGVPDLVVGDHDGFITLYLARSTDISENHSEELSEVFRVEPLCNPITDNFSIRLSSPAGPVNIDIYDSMGRMVSSSTVDGQSDTVVISAESMAIGVYTIVASDANNVSRCRVVVAN